MHKCTATPFFQNTNSSFQNLASNRLPLMFYSAASNCSGSLAQQMHSALLLFRFSFMTTSFFMRERCTKRKIHSLGSLTREPSRSTRELLTPKGISHTQGNFSHLREFLTPEGISHTQGNFSHV